MYSNPKKTDLTVADGLTNNSEALAKILPDFNFVFFGKDDLLNVLSQADCVGIKFRMGVSPKGFKTLIAFGVTGNGTEIQPAAARDLTTPPPGGVVLSREPCPDECPDDEE